MQVTQSPQTSEFQISGTCRVQLRRASLPTPFGWVAVHCWFTIFDPVLKTWHRWEVWQTADAGGTSWGHIHQNLKDPDADVGGGPCVLIQEWSGEEARRLAEIIAKPHDYPHRLRYRAWPGPNSNTYVSWVLRRAGIACTLSRRAIGRNYR